MNIGAYFKGAALTDSADGDIYKLTFHVKKEQLLADQDALLEMNLLQGKGVRLAVMEDEDTSFESPAQKKAREEREKYAAVMEEKRRREAASLELPMSEEDAAEAGVDEASTQPLRFSEVVGVGHRIIRQGKPEEVGEITAIDPDSGPQMRFGAKFPGNADLLWIDADALDQFYCDPGPDTPDAAEVPGEPLPDAPEPLPEDVPAEDEPPYDPYAEEAPAPPVGEQDPVAAPVSSEVKLSEIVKSGDFVIQRDQRIAGMPSPSPVLITGRDDEKRIALTKLGQIKFTRLDSAYKLYTEDASETTQDAAG